MNYSTAVFLINDKVRAVVGTYEAEENAKRSVFKTLDQSLEVGDFAIVPTDTRHKMTIIKIVDVDIDVDFDSPLPVQWVIGVVERGEYDQILAQERKAIDTVKSAELRRKRDDLRQAMFKDHVETLKTLEISSMADTPTKETPAS